MGVCLSPTLETGLVSLSLCVTVSLLWVRASLDGWWLQQVEQAYLSGDATSGLGCPGCGKGVFPQPGGLQAHPGLFPQHF